MLYVSVVLDEAEEGQLASGIKRWSCQAHGCFSFDRDDVCFADRLDLGQIVGNLFTYMAIFTQHPQHARRPKVVGVKPASLTSAALAKQWACNTVL